jgi:branched-chain amino acid transport system substrate-binding protein
MNEAGGIDGHPVKLIVSDDGADPGRGKANAKELVEKDGAIAFLAEFAPTARSAYADYMREKRIPVISGDQATTEFSTNPMYFPAGSNALVEVYGAIYEGKRLGAKRLAMLYCAEIAGCKVATTVARQAAQEQGVDYVYEGSISVAQPDYTAECLQARRAGADFVYPLGDPNTFARFARSCDRQGYHPMYMAVSAEQNDDLAKATGIQGGLIGAQPQISWFQREGTPGLAEFTQAMDKYAPGATARGQAVMTGWVAGKMVDKALLDARPLPATVQAADILRGLWSFKQETLGGLIPPMTFEAEKPAPVGNCWFANAVVNGKWVAPHGVTPTCPPISIKL